MTDVVKPCIKWVGGKTQIIEYILNTIPSTIENNYHEIFLGGGSVLLALLSKQRNGDIQVKGKIYAYDKNPYIISLFNNIKRNKDKLLQQLRIFEHEYCNIDVMKGNKRPRNVDEAMGSKESYYYWVRERFNETKEKETVKVTAMFIFLNKTCFRGVYREGPNGFNVPFGNYKNPKFLSETHVDEIHKLIQNVEFISCDFEESTKIRKQSEISPRVPGVLENDTVYLDPPYAPETGKSFVGYTGDGFSLEKHQRLFHLIHELNKNNVNIIMSNSKVDLITKNFHNYFIKEILAKRRIHSTKPNSLTTEVIINNFIII